MKKIILKKLLLVLTCLLSFTSLSAANYIKVNVGEQVLMYASESGVDYRWVIFNDDQGYVSDCYGGNGYPDYCLNTHKPTPPGVEIQVKCVIYEMEAGHKVPRNEDWFYITIVDDGSGHSSDPVQYIYFDMIGCDPANGSTGLPVDVLFKVKFAQLVERNPNASWYPTIGWAQFPMSSDFSYDTQNNTTTVTLTPLNWVGARKYLEENTKYPILIPAGFLRTINEGYVMSNNINLEFTTGTGSSGELPSTSELYYSFGGSPTFGYLALVVKPEGKTYAGDIVIPNTVTLGGYNCQVVMIAPQAFMGSKGLTSVTGNSIERTTDEAFKDCNNLTSVNLPLSDLRGDAIFSGCTNLKSVILYDYATELYKQTFYNCEKLPSYEIPSMVKTIGEEVFRGCSSFTEISLPKSVESVGDHAISDCANLKTIVIEGAPNTSSSGYPNLGVQFCNLPKLKDFYCKYEIPPAISVSGSFKNTKINYATLHVPSSAVDLYKSTAPWSGFASIVGDADATGINSVTSNSDDERIYDLQGNRLDKKKKGLNIIRKSDGRTVKVLVK